jgi:hypothetical protein
VTEKQYTGTAPPLKHGAGKNPDVRNVARGLVEAATAAATHMPEGCTVVIDEGYNPRHGTIHSQHRVKGRAALDLCVVRDNKRVRNRGEDKTGLYTLLHRHILGEMTARYPELVPHLGHGCNFGTSSRHPEEPDLMHVDLGGDRGHIKPMISELGPVPNVEYGKLRVEWPPPEPKGPPRAWTEKMERRKRR